MRFALVAGALVLSATVAEGRSVAPSPSKRTAEKMEFSTPSRTPSKRARHEDDGGDWNPVTESEDVSAGPDDDTTAAASTFQTQTPTARNTMRAKKAHKQHEMDSTYRTALPDFLDATAAPVTETLTEPTMRQAMQYEIIPVTPSNSSSSDSPSAAESRAYIIKPVAPVPAVDPVAATKPTVDGTISNSDLAGMVDHLKTKEDFKPAMALLRAIENYRQAVSDESSHSDAPKDSHSSSKPNNSSSSDPFSSANGNATLADTGSSDQ
ncbi:hypothetical protein PCASD_22362 [Puccinia coronata f. sp. avenae]|uniref:Uncharacterized protein n=1 Tax=Puccinia coronata f. sp. avenae TaxID=200324 RepID=A0A2N5SR75_9BASI|nr:hypothetical protein PCASD_22362 [Puccinia coronata f. sp. avenae]